MSVFLREIWPPFGDVGKFFSVFVKFIFTLIRYLKYEEKKTWWVATGRLTVMDIRSLNPEASLTASCWSSGRESYIFQWKDFRSVSNCRFLSETFFSSGFSASMPAHLTTLVWKICGTKISTFQSLLRKSIWCLIFPTRHISVPEKMSNWR